MFYDMQLFYYYVYFCVSVFTHGSINTHLLNSVYTVLTFVFCAKPVQLLHFYQPLVYAFCYILFSLVWHLTGNDPVYSILDWSDPASTIKVVLPVLFIAVPVLHLVIFALFTFRTWLSEKCGCTGNTRPEENKTEKEMTSRDEESRQQTNNYWYQSNSVHPST